MFLKIMTNKMGEKEAHILYIYVHFEYNFEVFNKKSKILIIFYQRRGNIFNKFAQIHATYILKKWSFYYNHPTVESKYGHIW